MSLPAPPPPIVDTEAALSALTDRLADAKVVALDTEFHAERRYRPELMLVQLAADGGPVITLDPLAIDLRPLGSVLEGRTWIAHGATWDVALLHAATGARPGTLLDTQLLAGLAGHPYPARLGDLSRAVLGQELDKSATLSNWRTRPLSADQLAYAQADVDLLQPLSAHLLAALSTLPPLRAPGGPSVRVDWASAAGAELTAAALAPPDPHHYWQSLDIAARLDGPTRQALRALYSWREAEASRRNTPAHYVLSPSIALDLARRRPASIEGLRANRRMPAGLIKRYGTVLIQVLHDARLAPVPPAIVAPTAIGLHPLIDAWCAVRAHELGIAVRLLAPRDLTRRIAIEGVAALEGWRLEALGPGLGRLLDGHTCLRVAPGQVVREVHSPESTPTPASGGGSDPVEQS